MVCALTFVLTSEIIRNTPGLLSNIHLSKSLLVVQDMTSVQCSTEGNRYGASGTSTTKPYDQVLGVDLASSGEHKEQLFQDGRDNQKACCRL
jgi:hypothetical protein